MIRLRRVLAAVASALRVTSFAFLVPVPFALLFEPHDVPFLAGLSLPASVAPFLASFVAATLVWVPLRLATRSVQDEDLLDREGYLAVALGWLAATLLATLPFTFARLLGPIDAFYEAMSATTGTASTVVAGWDRAPESLLVWRVLLPWVGGLAIIVLVAALLARLTHGGLPVLQGTGVAGGARLKPKLAEVARSLWMMYASVTLAVAALLAVLLWAREGLAPLDAGLQGLLQAMMAYSLGGVADPAGPWPGAGDPAIDLVLVAAMLLGGTNFALTFGALRKGTLRPVAANPEWRFTMGTFGAVTAVAALLLVRAGHDAAQALHHAAYTVASLLTGTGNYVTDYATWPPAVLLLLLLLMLMGASTGTPSGGVKALRWLVLVQLFARELRKLLHPKAVIPVRVGPAIVKEETLGTVIAFVFSFLVLWTLGTVALLAVQPGLEATDSAAAAASALANVGAGFGSLGPSHGSEDLRDASKVLLAALMWFGRLEIFTALLLFAPGSWRN